MTTLKEDLSKAFFDSKDLQETINKTILTDRHNEVYSFKEIFRKHEGTTVEGDLIGDVADDLVETIERVSTKVDDIISLVRQLKDWSDDMDEERRMYRLGKGGDLIDELYDLFFTNEPKMFLTDEQLSDIAKGGWKPLSGKTGVAWFGGKTHTTLANQVPSEDLENFEDLNFLVVAYQRASQDG